MQREILIHLPYLPKVKVSELKSSIYLFHWIQTNVTNLKEASVSEMLHKFRFVLLQHRLDPLNPTETHSLFMPQDPTHQLFTFYIFRTQYKVTPIHRTS